MSVITYPLSTTRAMQPVHPDLTEAGWTAGAWYKSGTHGTDRAYSSPPTPEYPQGRWVARQRNDDGLLWHLYDRNIPGGWSRWFQGVDAHHEMLWAISLIEDGIIPSRTER